MTEIEVVKGIGWGCDEVCVEVLKELAEKKNWIPGKQEGKEVKVKMVMPIYFSL